MSKLSTWEQLTAVLRDVFDNDELVASPDLAAADVEGWDSLGNVRLFMELERRCAVRFSAMEISSLENVGQLADLLEQKNAF